jgi:hypothetical protein
MSFEHSSTDDYFFSDELVLHESILVGNSCLRSHFHEFSSKDFNVALVLHKYSILLDVILVPEEKIIFERMLYGSNQTFVRSFNNFDH